MINTFLKYEKNFVKWCEDQYPFVIEDATKNEKARKFGRYPFFRHSVCSQNSEKLSFFEFFRFS